MLPVACLMLLVTSDLLALQAGLTSAWFWIPEVVALICLIAAWAVGGTPGRARARRVPLSGPSRRWFPRTLLASSRSIRTGLGV